MHIKQTAISLNVPDPLASAAFLREHLGHTSAMEADGFVSMKHPSGGPNIVFLRTGLGTFKPAHRAGDAGEGMLLVFVVDGLDQVHESIAAAGARVITEPETEPWGERYCQYEDPNGLIIQLVEWVEQPRDSLSATTNV